MALQLHVTQSVADKLIKTIPPGEIWPVGPLHKLVPNYFHQFIKKEVLNSYLADTTLTGDLLQEATKDDDQNERIAVIIFPKAEKVFQQVVENLIPGIGVKALKDMHPWIINVLIDWSNFDVKISTKPKNNDADIMEPMAAQDDSQATECSESLSEPSGPVFWNKNDTKLLLDEYKHHTEYSQNGNHKTKKKMWTEIAKNMSDKYQCNYTWEQCQVRFKTLTTAYKKTKDHNRKTGNDTKHCPFEEELDKLFGSKPSLQPVAINTTNAIVKKDVIERNEDEENKSTQEVKNAPKPKSVKKRKASSEVLCALNSYMKKQETEREQERMERKEMHNEKMKLLQNLIDTMKK